MSLRYGSRLLNLIEEWHNYDRNSTLEEIISIIKSQDLYDAVTALNETLIHYATLVGNRQILQYLIDSGSKVDVQTFLGQTPLMMALDSDEGSAGILIKAGADIYKRDVNGMSALQMVGNRDDCQLGNNTLLDLFFQRVQSDCMNSNERIAGILFDAQWILPKIVLIQDVDLTNIMLQRGCDVEATNSRGRTALHVAVMIVDVKIVKLLLDHNANANAADLYDRAPLSYVYPCSENTENDKRLEIMKLLLGRGADLTRDSVHTSENWPIYYLLWNGNREAIEWLLETYSDLAGFLVNDNNGNSLAHLLAQNENPGVIELLRARSFAVDACNRNGRTPLMLAASCGVPNAVQFLLDAGADIDATNSGYFTSLESIFIAPSDATRKRRYRDCVQILLERGANTFLADLDEVDQKTILDDVLEHDHFQLGELVLSELALQEALGTHLTELIRNEINSNQRFKDNFESSKEELTLTVYGSITVFDLLTESDRKFERYVRNRDLYSKLTDFSSKKCRFHYFKTILQKRISKAIHTVKMRKKAAHVISEIMRMEYERFPLISDEIVSFLREEDMKSLMVVISHD